MGTLKTINWYERNSKKTIFIVIFFILIAIVFVFETIFDHYNKKNLVNLNYKYRYILLREFPPLKSTFIYPTQKIMNKSDTLQFKKYIIRSDRNGFIIPSEKYKNPDKVIVFLGGSTTECEYVEEEKRFPYRVGCILENKLSKKINSYNGGYAGNNSSHSLFSLMSKVLPLNPTAVIMMHNINDLVILLYEGSYFTKNPSKSIIITENYTLFRLLGGFIKKFLPNLSHALLQVPIIAENVQTGQYGDEFADIRNRKVISDQDKAYIINEFGENIQIFIYICKAKGIIPVLMTMPSRIKDNPDKIILNAVNKLRVDLDYQEFKVLFDCMNEVIRCKANENGIMVIDLATQIPQDGDYMYDIVHLTENGCTKVAEVVSNKLYHLLSKTN